MIHGNKTDFMIEMRSPIGHTTAEPKTGCKGMKTKERAAGCTKRKVEKTTLLEEFGHKEKLKTSVIKNHLTKEFFATCINQSEEKILELSLKNHSKRKKQKKIYTLTSQ